MWEAGYKDIYGQEVIKEYITATLNDNQTAIAACIKACLDNQIITCMYSTSKPIPSLLSNPNLGTMTNLLPLMSLSIYLVWLSVPVPTQTSTCNWLIGCNYLIGLWSPDLPRLFLFLKRVSIYVAW